MKMPIPKPFALFAASGTILLGLIVPSARIWAQNATSPPAAKAATDEHAAGAARGVTVPAVNGVGLKAQINGQGPFDAVFDTGAGNLMTASLAKRLGLKLGGAVTMIAGGGNVPAQGVKVATVKIGDLTMTDQWFTVVDLPYSKDEEGIFVGEELVRALPIKVDFEKQQITFYDARVSITPGMELRFPSNLRRLPLWRRAAWTGFRDFSPSTPEICILFLCMLRL